MRAIVLAPLTALLGCHPKSTPMQQPDALKTALTALLAWAESADRQLYRDRTGLDEPYQKPKQLTDAHEALYGHDAA